MPNSAASRRRAFTVSAPALCPSTTGSPRRWAQRPLPSVMMATYRAARPSPPTCSDLEDLGFLALEQAVELGDARVGELLQLDLGAMLVVGADVAAVPQFAQVVHHVTPDVPDGHAPLLGDVADHLHELPAALLVELGDREPDELAVVVRREPDVGLHDRLLDGLDRRGVVGLHAQQAGLGGRDRSQLLER